MKIFHFHLGYGDCNCGDKWLAIGAKNLIIHSFGVDLKDIYERNIYEKNGKQLSWDELIEAVNHDNYDLVFIGGGGWLGDSSPLWYGKPWTWYKKLRVPYVVYGVGYNASRCVKLPKEYFINQINNLNEIKKDSIFFAVRADGTKEQLEGIGLGFETMECPDPAFFVERDTRSKILNENYVIFNIAGDVMYHRYDGNKIPAEIFCRKINTLGKFFINKGYKIYFAKHVPSDGLCFNFLDWDPKMVQILNWEDMLKNGLNYYQYAKMVIGMRGHAQVIPIALKVPVISISTTDKNVGLMKNLGLLKYNVEVNDENLEKKIQTLAIEIEKNPTDLIEQYNKKLEEMTNATKEIFTVISERLEKTKIMGELQKLAGDYNLMRGPFDEDYDEQYGSLDYKDKVILDIGADYGSSPMFFLRKGAKKVIAVESNADYVNVLHKIEKKVKEVISVDFKISCGYNISNLIKKYSPDIVKVDCDGCEVFLLQMTDIDIKLVKDWILELHSVNVYNAIKDLFIRNEFEIKFSRFDSVSQWAWVVLFSRST